MLWHYLEEDIDKTAREILENFPNIRHFLLKGPLGAGKTSLVSGFARVLGINDPVSSPTYSLIQEYSGNNHVLYHMDLFRTKGLEEIGDLGFWEYADSGHYMFLEWPEKIQAFLEQDYLEIQISHSEYGGRTLLITQFSPVKGK